MKTGCNQDLDIVLRDSGIAQALKQWRKCDRIGSGTRDIANRDGSGPFPPCQLCQCGCSNRTVESTVKSVCDIVERDSTPGFENGVLGAGRQVEIQPGLSKSDFYLHLIPSVRVRCFQMMEHRLYGSGIRVGAAGDGSMAA